MATKRSNAGDTGHVIPSPDFSKLVDLMDELAFRGPTEEALMVRVANAAGISEVIARIKKRRQYLKRSAAAVSNGAEVEATPARKKGSGTRKPGGGRRRSDRKVKSAPGGGGDADTGRSHSAGEAA